MHVYNFSFLLYFIVDCIFLLLVYFFLSEKILKKYADWIGNIPKVSDLAICQDGQGRTQMIHRKTHPQVCILGGSRQGTCEADEEPSKDIRARVSLRLKPQNLRKFLARVCESSPASLLSFQL